MRAFKSLNYSRCNSKVNQDNADNHFKFRFPNIAEHGSQQQPLSININTSLLDQDNAMPNNHSNSASYTLVLQVLWRALQTSIGKMGVMILFASLLLMGVAPASLILLWIERVGIGTGLIVFGLSIFVSLPNNTRINNDPTKDSTDEPINFAKSQF